MDIYIALFYVYNNKPTPLYNFSKISFHFEPCTTNDFIIHCDLDTVWARD